jgi:hypothetical protein
MHLLSCHLLQPFSHNSGFTLLGALFLPQDPTNLDKFNVSNFFHVKNNMKITDPGMYN